MLALYVAHRDALVNYANGIVGNREQAEDVVQEAYLRFDSGSAGRLIEEPVGYLYRIVRNLALDGRRRWMRESRHLDQAGETAVNAAVEQRPSPEDQILARGEIQLLAEALAELPARTRIAVEMHRFGGCKLKEIAAHLGISTTLAHDLVFQGVEHCRRRLRRP
jgi:RNA polymerase sigma-70 factor (ECF subfamily)